MNVDLGDVFDKLIAELLQTGMYLIGSEQADHGEFVDGEEAFAEIRRRSTKRKCAK